MKKSLLIAATTLAFSQLSFAQDGQISVGPAASQLFNSEAASYGVSFDYKGKDGLFVPVNIQVGSDVQKFTAGVGLTTAQSKSVLTYSAAAAMAHLSFSEDLEGLIVKDQKRFALLLQQELSFQLSNRLDMGIHLDMDVLNWVKKDVIRNSSTGDYYKSVGRLQDEYGWTDSAGNRIENPKYESQEAKEAAFDSATKTGASGVGLSLKIRLGK